MDRQVIDLGIARSDEAQMISEWDYLYIGDCDGIVTLKMGAKSTSGLNPEEFDKMSDIRHLHYIRITNTAQAGKKLVIYFKKKKRGWTLWR